MGTNLNYDACLGRRILKPPAWTFRTTRCVRKGTEVHAAFAAAHAAHAVVFRNEWMVPMIYFIVNRGK